MQADSRPTPTPPARTWPQRFVRGLGWSAVGLYVALCLVVLLLKWVVVPQLSDHKPKLEQTLSTLTGQPVHIGAIQATWVGWVPQIRVEQFQLGDLQSPQGGLAIGQLQGQLAFRSLFTGAPRFEFLDVQGLHLTLTRDTQGQHWLAGQALVDNGSQDNPALDWLLRQNQLTARAAQFTWVDYAAATPNQPAPQTTLTWQAWVKNRLGHHALKLEAESPGLLVQPLSLNLEFETPLWLLSLDNTQHWRGRFYALLQAQHLKPLNKWLGTQQYKAQVKDINAQVWAEFERGAVQAGTLGLMLAKLTLDDTRVNAPAVEFQNLQAHLDLQGFKPQQWEGQVWVKQLQAQLPTGEQFGPLDVRMARAVNMGLQDLTLEFAELDAGRTRDTVALLAPHLRQTDFANQVNQLEVTGHIQKLALNWQLPLGSAQPTTADNGTAALLSRLGFGAHVEFQNLALYRLEQVSGTTRKTGFSGLNGQFVGNQAKGEWKVSGDNASVSLPELFEQPQKQFEHLEGQGSWKDALSQQGSAVFEVQNLSVSNPDAALTAQGAYTLDINGPDAIDLHGKLTRADVSRVAEYLPVVVGAKARAWLASNLKGGRATSGHFVLKGQLDQFPFDQPGHAGEFLIQAQVEDGALTYAPGWPAITGVKGSLQFKGMRMLIEADQAQTQGVQLEKVRALIASLDAWEPELVITGMGRGDLQNMLSFVRASPVSDILNKALDDAQGGGDADLDLKLNIPLAKPERTQVKGLLALRNNSIKLVHGMPLVTALQGSLEFSNQGLQLKPLRGRALGAAVSFSGGSQKNGYLDIRATGLATASGLADYLNPLLGPYLQGDTPYDVQVTTDPNSLTVKVKSNLQGLSLAMPAPFQKKVDELLPLELQQTITKQGDLWQGRVGAEGKALGVLKANYQPSKKEDKLQSLQFAIGADLGPDTPGIVGKMNVDELDVEAWSKVVGDVMGKLPQGKRVQSGILAPLFEGDDAGPLVRMRMDLKAKQIKVAKKTFSGLAVSAKTVENKWQVDLKGQGVDGYFSWYSDAQRPDGTLLARFKTLVIPKSVDSDIKDMVDDPVSSIPALDVRVDRFVLGDMDLGRLKLVAINQTKDERVQAEANAKPKVWKLEELRIENPESNTSAKGTWQYGKALRNQQTSLELNMEVSDAGGLLARLGSPGLFKGGKGGLSGQVSWADAPTHLDYDSLSGQLKLNSKNGQFLKADPGVAKLLGVLSLQSLPRRLSLDFKDVFSEGFAYDSLEADINLEKGVARMPNFKMLSPAATVLMDGQFNMAKETQNLNVVVLPDLNPTGGSLIYSLIAANPAVGIASFIADFLLKDPLAKIFSFEYKVTGTWTNPEVNRVARNNPPQTPNEPAL